jgi:hypothetical protein
MPRLGITPMSGDALSRPPVKGDVLELEYDEGGNGEQREAVRAKALGNRRNRKSIKLEPCSVKRKSRTPIMTITERVTNKTKKRKCHIFRT